MLNELRVGHSQAGDGAQVAARAGRTGEQIISNLHGWYHEKTSRGGLFHVSTPVAGVAPGTALSTTPPMAIYNPMNSGVIVEILRVFLGYVSGTLGAGTMVHAFVQQTTDPTAGTELVPRCGLLSGIKSKSRAFQGATLSAAPTIIRPSAIIGAGLASTATFPAIAMDEVGSSIEVPPGAAWAYQGVAVAGTTPLVLIGVEFGEIIIP